MTTWTCPNCGRDFGAVGRGHMCHPGRSVEDFLDAAPPFVRPVFCRIDEHLRRVDDEAGGHLIVDPLERKVLFKNGPTFCIVEVKTKWVAVGFQLRRRLESSRLSRKVLDNGSKFFHVVNVEDPALIDAEFGEWLTEAYHHGDEPAVSRSSRDPMVPDDVDIW